MKSHCLIILNAQQCDKPNKSIKIRGLLPRNAGGTQCKYFGSESEVRTPIVYHHVLNSQQDDIVKTHFKETEVPKGFPPLHLLPLKVRHPVSRVRTRIQDSPAPFMLIQLPSYVLFSKVHFNEQGQCPIIHKDYLS